MTQELVTKQTAIMPLLTAKKQIFKILSLLLLLAVTMSGFAQNASNSRDGLSIKNVIVHNESVYGKVNGSIEIIFSGQPADGKYKITYDLHASGNRFSHAGINLTGNRLVVNNLRSGQYFNLSVVKESDGAGATWSQNFTVQAAEFVAGNNSAFGETNTTNATCSGSISYTDCSNTSRSTPSSVTTGKGYNSTSSGTPCGYEISSTCTVVNISKWHCLDADLSAPPSNNSYTITNYSGAGLSALQACRINWIVCNYSSITSDVTNAIWKISGTGGSSNSIYTAALAAVTVANGTENSMVFYKSGSSSYQDMVKYSCVTTPCTGRISSLVFNKLDNGLDLQITNGATFTVAQLGSLYNIEAITSGTVGSVKFTITGPTASNNIENTIPYESPGSGSGAWTGTPGNYSVNLKVYSSSDASGTICHDTTISFVLTNVCNPNDPTAGNGTSFCAPAPICAAGNFSWNQTINSSTGAASTVRLVSGTTNSYTIPAATYPAAFSGPVNVTVTDAVSYDGYVGRNSVTQLNERWRIVFKKSGATVGATPYTTDIPDLVNQGFWRGALGTTILLPNGADQIIIEHYDVANGYNGPGSVNPVSICLSYSAVAAATNPDFNSTFVNVSVSGNVSTNDQVPAGTTYGTSPTLLSSPAGSSPSITMNSNGTYSFVSNLPGVYTYDVPVCVPGQSAPCPPTKLVITVLNANIQTNLPVANVDIATTKINTAVTLKTLTNDAAGNSNTALVPSSVTVTVAPLHGSTSVNAATGDITYTPASGYTGTDTLTYQVCDNQSPAKCATAKQIITILPSGAVNTTAAADDYKTTDINTPASGNVKTNDTDAEGNAQTVTAQTTTVAGKGTLVLATDGSYTFTPVTGFIGPVDFPYTTCDNGSPQACASATLHILVRPVVPATNPDFNSTFVNVPVPGNVSTNDKVPAGTTYGTSPTLLSSPAGSTPSITMNSNGTYSFVSNLPGVYTYDVPVCVPGQSTPCPPTKLVITVLDATISSNSPVANVDIATTKINTAVALKTLANDAAGNLNSALVPSSVTVTVAPLHGTTSVNTTTGDITYTPATGYTGTDTLTYQVCDNQSPAKCATAKQIITIIPAGAVNTTSAADDYKISSINMNATGNVKTNDVDPEGNTQTVTAQNTTITGKGTLILATDGSYTFVPVTGFTGPVDFPYTTCDNGTPQACANATLHILVKPEVPYPNPDFNSTYVNVPVPGNVSTNDKVPAGTTYGTSPSLLSSPAGSSPVLTMNANGTYSFVSDMPGVYTYDVPVCVPNQIIPCPPTKLVITVLNSNVSTNPPVANVDIATTNINIPVTLKTLANDAAANASSSLVASSVTVTVAPLHGTTSVNPATGDITYTPATGYTGTDTLTYQVCDNQSPAKCAVAKQIITIKPPTAANTTAAADDYRITDINTPASGNVKTNDTDPENNTQTVAPQTTTVAGKGTLVLASDGSYTFTPVNGYTGPVDFPYTTCDNGVPQACAGATLHILVRPIAPATNPDFNATFVNVPVPGNVSTNDKVPAGSTYGTSPTLLSSPAGSSPTIVMNADGTYNFVSNVKGVYIYNVPVCVPGQSAPCPPTKLTITVLDGPANTNAPVANVDIAKTKVNTPVTLKTLINDASGNTNSSLVPSSVTVTVAPLHGTTSVNPATGDITYTPASGYTGTDTLTYQVCDNQSPSKCATANQIITILPAAAPNSTEAADDFKIVPFNTAGSGNVKPNDNDPEGHTQTVTPQNTTIGGKGNLVLGSDGSYIFTPFAGFTGPVDYPYTTCDNGTPQACANATLHILVRPLVQVPDLTPLITAVPNVILDTMNFNVTVKVQELDNAPTNGSEILVRIIKDSRITFTYNPALTTIGFTPVQNSVWTYDGSDPFFHIFKTSVVIGALNSSTFGFIANFNPGGKSRGKYTMTSSLNSGSGGETKTNNNQDADILDYLYR